MKVKIGPYLNWVGPFQIAEMLFFWVKKYDENFDHTPEYNRVYNFGKWLSEDKYGNDSYLTRFCQWVQDHRHRTVKIRIDNFDVWSMDTTVSLIILPMLKQLKATKQGSPFVDLKDVPEHLRGTETEGYDSQTTFEFYNAEGVEKLDVDIHKRWDWVLDEMIWAHQALLDDNAMELYCSIPSEMDISEHPEDEGKTVVPLRWKVKGVYDWDKIRAHEERVQNGLRLFGIYYQGLWT